MAMSSFVAELKKIPPVTRFLCGSTLAVSLPVMMELVPPTRVLHVWVREVSMLEIWRPFTSFFLGKLIFMRSTGSGIGFLFDFLMLYRSSGEVETTYYAGRSPDYAWQTFLACGAILGLCTPLRSYIHQRPLLLSLLTLHSKLSPPGAQTSMMGLITFPLEYLPYAMVVIDLVMGGRQAAAEAIVGVLVGWGWWLRVRHGGSLKAPSWVKMFVADGPVTAGPLGGVHVIPSRAGGSTSGHAWGRGHRLG